MGNSTPVPTMADEEPPPDKNQEQGFGKVKKKKDRKSTPPPSESFLGEEPTEDPIPEVLEPELEPERELEEPPGPVRSCGCCGNPLGEKELSGRVSLSRTSTYWQWILELPEFSSVRSLEHHHLCFACLKIVARMKREYKESIVEEEEAPIPKSTRERKQERPLGRSSRVRPGSKVHKKGKTPRRSLGERAPSAGASRKDDDEEEVVSHTPRCGCCAKILDRADISKRVSTVKYWRYVFEFDEFKESRNVDNKNLCRDCIALVKEAVEEQEELPKEKKRNVVKVVTVNEEAESGSKVPVKKVPEIMHPRSKCGCCGGIIILSDPRRRKILTSDHWETILLFPDWKTTRSQSNPLICKEPCYQRILRYAMTGKIGYVPKRNENFGDIIETPLDRKRKINDSLYDPEGISTEEDLIHQWNFAIGSTATLQDGREVVIQKVRFELRPFCKDFKKDLRLLVIDAEDYSAFLIPESEIFKIHDTLQYDIKYQRNIGNNKKKKTERREKRKHSEYSDWDPSDNRPFDPREINIEDFLID